MRIPIFFLLVFVFLTSCSKEDGKDQNPPVEDTPVFTLEINGKKWNPTEYYYKVSSETTFIFATDLTYTFSWEFEKELSIKKYTLGLKENELISSMHKSIDNNNYAYNIISGELSILKYDKDSQILKCDFNFNAEYKGDTLEIKNGHMYIEGFK